MLMVYLIDRLTFRYKGQGLTFALVHHRSCNFDLLNGVSYVILSVGFDMGYYISFFQLVLIRGMIRHFDI